MKLGLDIDKILVMLMVDARRMIESKGRLIPARFDQLQSVRI
jgi:hypothetical protein